ncbi:hypothetical protein WA158_003685 [Blastocystis sp. Blastoise]
MSTNNSMDAMSNAVEMIKKARAIVFDIDFTSLSYDGLDYLAEITKKTEEVRKCVKELYIDKHILRECLDEIMKIMSPNLNTIEQFKNEIPVDMPPHYEELVDLLRSMNKDIYLVSAGIKQLQEPLCKKLHITDEYLFDNVAVFDSNGNFTHLIAEQLTMENDGKAKVIEVIKKRYPDNDNIVVNFGDGYIDSEACPPSDCFIRYTKYNNTFFENDHSTISIDDYSIIIDLLKNNNTNN